MPAKVYTQKEAKITPIKKKTLAVIGYGSQGHAHALNLKDSGCNVIIGLYKGSKSIRVAKRHGFEVMEVPEAVQKADVIMIGVPDMKQAEVYEKEIKPNLSKGKTLLFTHGFAIHFGLIKPPRGGSVIIVAPKGPGHIVRSQYKEGKGVPSLIAVLKGSSKDSKKIALAWAAGIGAGRAGILQTSFKEETETDLFGEQTVLCGGLTSLITASWETLVEAGYSPEMAYFECLHEVKLIVDLMYEGGIANMRYSISNTAEYGDYLSGPRVIDAGVKERMKHVLEDIQSGKFVQDWMMENKVGAPRFKSMRRRAANHDIEKVGKKLRDMMPWIAENALVNKEKN